MDRVFLDANVLFSAAYRPRAGLQRLWKLADVQLLTSAYALDEARRNLTEPAQRARLTRLKRALTIIDEPPQDQPLPKGMTLPDKDKPIFLAALEGKATHLVTGDLTHFGPYFGTRIEGILIVPPADYLALREGEDAKSAAKG